MSFSPVRCARWFLLLAIGSPLLNGCGGGDGLPRKEVSGSVTLDGQPLPNGSIQFLPETTAEGDAFPGGSVIEAGRYQIRREDGLLPGTYKVVILSHKNVADGAAADGAPGGGFRAPPELIPARYNAMTTLSAGVTPDGTNVFDFELISKGDPE